MTLEQLEKHFTILDNDPYDDKGSAYISARRYAEGYNGVTVIKPDDDNGYYVVQSKVIAAL